MRWPWELPDTDEIAVMRDPFVFAFDGRAWVILGAGLHDGSPAVLLFNRDDETAWTYEGLFATSSDPSFEGADPADIWECPQLVRVDDRWVLILSLQHQQALGRVVAVVGDVALVDRRPRFVPERLNVLDEGQDFYAPQVVDVDGRPLLIGWIRQTDQDPAVTDHAGCMTLPRRLALRDGVVTSDVEPIAADALTRDRSGWPALHHWRVCAPGLSSKARGRTSFATSSERWRSRRVQRSGWTATTPPGEARREVWVDASRKTESVASRGG